MSELISRQKLIEELETEILENPIYNPEEECIEYGISPARMFEIIKSQPSADVPDTNVGKWIPCSERLPEECDVYWTTVKPNCSYEPFVTTSAYYPSIEEWEGGVEVLAWMPSKLSEPYKGE